MHVLGTGYRGWIDRYEGEEDCIVESQQYDFGNQLTYVLNEPVTVTGGDTVNFSAHGTTRRTTQITSTTHLVMFVTVSAPTKRCVSRLP